MKPLILILLAVTWADAQTIADLARAERARQAKVQSTRTIKTEDLKTIEPTTTVSPDAGKPAVVAETPAAPAAPPAVDPIQLWNDEVGKIRTKLRGLQDQEAVLQLAINDLTNKVFAPVTNQTSRAQAQTALDTSQKQLALIRAEIVTTRLELQHLEEIGPPVKK